MKAEKFDQSFDRGKDVTSAREARRLSVTRQSIIKVWIAERRERRDA